MKLQIKEREQTDPPTIEEGQIWVDESIGGVPYVVSRLYTKRGKVRYQLTNMLTGAPYDHMRKKIDNVFAGDEEDFVFVGRIKDPITFK